MCGGIRLRKSVGLALSFALATSLFAAAQDAGGIRATTDDGRKVVLRSDGTWAFAPSPAVRSSNAVRFVKSPKATTKVSAPFGKFALWIDPNRWTESKSENGKITLKHVNGQGYATIISEALGVPTSTLKDLALDNVRRVDPNAQLVAQENRVVNDRDVLCLQMNASLKNLPFTYYGYYYGGSSGNVQVVTYTLQSAFAANKQEFTELLNGLEISDQPLPPTTDASRSH
jgi:hypothetical protein